MNSASRFPLDRVMSGITASCDAGHKRFFDVKMRSPGRSFKGIGRCAFFKWSKYLGV